MRAVRPYYGNRVASSMKILLTGGTGYIGKRLLPSLVQAGHHVVCLVRDANRFQVAPEFAEQVDVIESDLLKPESLGAIPKDIDGAYYLVHSMSSHSDYTDLEKRSATNFRNALSQSAVKHVIYLSGMANEEVLSEHLQSRKYVEEELSKGDYNFTTLRAGIIIGSGSASFEIIRDLVEKLPVMIAPKWLNTKCQPIGIVDVIELLSKTLFNDNTYNQNFDIGGPDVLTYKQMLLRYAQCRGIARRIVTVPVMTPKLSSYWLYFVTSTSYKLAIALVDSMKIEVVSRNNDLQEILGVHTMSYQKAVERALSQVQDDLVVSSWKDSFISSNITDRLDDRLQVPTYGCFIDERKRRIKHVENTIDRIWKLGGKNGYYYGSWLWALRGYLDKLVGGVGLRRGRTNENTINAGDALDFWRVMLADRATGRLVLFAEMKLPGEAWLEFKVHNDTLIQKATFRPKGVLGRLYWFMVLPFHGLIFSGMINKLTA